MIRDKTVIINSEILVNKHKIVNSIKDIMEQVLRKYFNEEMLVDTAEKNKTMQKINNEKCAKLKTNTFGI